MGTDLRFLERTILALTGLLWPFMVVVAGTVFVIVSIAPWERYRALSEKYDMGRSGITLKDPSVSIYCETERLPLRGVDGDSLYVLRLHPKWGNTLDKFLYSSGPASYWPSQYRTGTAYRCLIKTTGTSKIIDVSVPVTIFYRSDKTPYPSRSAEPMLPVAIEAMNPFVFHVLDDTGWTPTVEFPRSVIGRVDGQSKSTLIPVGYGTRDGTPLQLSGFN